MYRSILSLYLCFASICVFSQIKNDSIVFIGEKISEESYSPSKMKNDTMKVAFLDYAIKVRYHILYKLRNNYNSDTIEFISFDHSGDFNFTKPRYVLLSVKKTSDGFYLPKYEYKTVAKSIDGKWAFRGNDIRLDKELMNKAIFQPILFEENFSYAIKSKKRLKKRFPKTYYKKENDKMIPIKGVYVDSLYK